MHRKISASVDGGLSGGSSVRRPGSEDLHRCQRKFYQHDGEHSIGFVSIISALALRTMFSCFIFMFSIFEFANYSLYPNKKPAGLISTATDGSASPCLNWAWQNLVHAIIRIPFTTLVLRCLQVTLFTAMGNEGLSRHREQKLKVVFIPFQKIEINTVINLSLYFRSFVKL